MIEDALERVAPPCRISSSPLPGLQSDLFVQAECHRVTAATELIHTHGVGVVYAVDPMRRPHAKQDSAGAIQYTRKHAPQADILIDASRYTGKRRKFASSPPTRDWVSFQRHHQLPWALTDSGYIAAGDAAGLATTLSAGAGMGPGVIVALPMAGKWLTDDASMIRARIEHYSTPVALMIEDDEDPFDQPGAVAGLIEVLAADTPVLLLRSDTAALGALAYGAAGTAVGTTSTYRHIYPLRDGGGGANHLSFLVPLLLGYFLDRRVNNAYLLDSGLAAWRCRCTYCGGVDLTWIANSTQPQDAAFQHSVAAIADLGRDLTDAVALGHTASSAWTQMCLHAQLEHFAVSEATDGLWTPKNCLGEWIKAAPSTVGV